MIQNAYIGIIWRVDPLLKKNRVFRIGDFDLLMRRLATPAKVVVISNIYLSIPYELIETVLIGFGLQLLSPSSFLRAGIPNDENSHILSL